MKTLLYRICQCTYGILQTFPGLCLFLIYCKENHSIYHGAVVTERKHGGSISLGMFLFVSVKNMEKSAAEKKYLILFFLYRKPGECFGGKI